MNGRWLWLALALIGVAVPYAVFLPWVIDHGLDVRLFAEQMFANRIASFFALDVLISAATVVALLTLERRMLGARAWLPVAGLLAVASPARCHSCSG